jgi:hypothetical protein
LSGQDKKIISIIILGISGLILFGAMSYLHRPEKTGYLLLVPDHQLNLMRWTIGLHGFSAFILILLTSILIFGRIEHKWPNFHRKLGKITLFIGIILLIPTGFILSFLNSSGTKSSVLFIALTSLSLMSIISGWKKIRSGDQLTHSIWMKRFYILLTSAIWLRINMFIAFEFFIPDQNIYFYCVLLSWVPQLIVYEFWEGHFRT